MWVGISAARGGPPYRSPASPPRRGATAAPTAARVGRAGVRRAAPPLLSAPPRVGRHRQCGAPGGIAFPCHRPWCGMTGHEHCRRCSVDGRAFFLPPHTRWRGPHPRRAGVTTRCDGRRGPRCRGRTATTTGRRRRHPPGRGQAEPLSRHGPRSRPRGTAGHVPPPPPRADRSWRLQGRCVGLPRSQRVHRGRQRGCRGDPRTAAKALAAHGGRQCGAPNHGRPCGGTMGGAMGS